MIKGKGWCSQTIKEEYANSFYFYFVKPINSIVAGDPSPQSILYKDYLYWDQNQEIMRRYYTIPETEVRLRNYIASYQEIYDRYPPNLCVIKPFKILVKRTKRFLNQIRREQEEQQAKKSKRRGAMDNMLPVLMRPPIYLSSKDFSTSFDQENNTKVQQASHESEGLLDKISFNTTVHDIYNPEYSSIQSLSDALKQTSAKIMETAEYEDDFEMPEERIRKSKSNANLISNYYSSSPPQQQHDDRTVKAEKLSDLFQKYKTNFIGDVEIAKNSHDKFQDAFKGVVNFNTNSKTMDADNKPEKVKNKKESTTATDRDSEPTKEKILNLANKMKFELEEKSVYPGATPSLKSRTIQAMSLNPKHLKDFGQALSSRLDFTLVNKTPLYKNDLNPDGGGNTKRSVDGKTKRKGTMNQDTAPGSVQKSSGVKKSSVNPPVPTRERLLERLNTERSCKQKWINKDSSRSKTHYDLFKSVKASENTLKKRIKKIVMNHRKKSDKKKGLQKAGSSSENRPIGSSFSDLRSIPPFYTSLKYNSTLISTAKKTQDNRPTSTKANKSSSKNRDYSKNLQSFQGRSLANISSNMSVEKNNPHYLYGKKQSREHPCNPLAISTINQATLIQDPPKSSRHSTSKNKKFDSLVKRLIENSNHQTTGKKQSVKSGALGALTDRYAYFSETDSNRMYLKGLFTPLAKNK